MSDDPTVTARPATSLNSRPDFRGGTAPIKAESVLRLVIPIIFAQLTNGLRYLLQANPVIESTSSIALNDQATHPYADDDAAEGRSSTAKPDARDFKRQKTTKRDKERTGQNKARSFPVVREAGVRICRTWEKTGICSKEGCKFAHNWNGYFAVKPHDIHYDPALEITKDSPFMECRNRLEGGVDNTGRTVDLGTTCPVFADLGHCPYGWRCRFLGGHVKRVEEGDDQAMTCAGRLGEWELLGKRGESSGAWRNRETNWPDHEMMTRLRRNQVCRSRTSVSLGCC